MKQRALSNIEKPRSRISIGIALAKDVFENNGSAPIGMDAFTLWSNVYAVGIFSRLSIVAFLSNFKNYIDEKIWTVYRLSDCPMLMNPDKKIYPKQAFSTGSQAVTVTKALLGNDSSIYKAHEILALKLRESAL